MRCSPEEAAREIEKRAALLRRRRERRKIAALFTLTSALLTALVFSVEAQNGGPAAVWTSGAGYGSILLAEGAGGYVLAGVIAFAAGVTVTMLCIRRRGKNPAEEKEHREDGD